MRIAYIAFIDTGHESGVLKKIRSQIDTWIAAGNEVRLFAVSPTQSVWDGIVRLPVEVIPSSSLTTRVFQVAKLSVRVRAWKPEVAYLRFGTYYPSLTSVMRNVPTVLEVNTDDIAEYRLVLSRWKYIYHLATRKRLIKNARGLVFVTRELAKRFGDPQKPFTIIANGINLSEYQAFDPPDNVMPRLVFIGHPGHPWHGVDNLVTMAVHFPKWRFDVIGYTNADLGQPVPPNVTLWGYLPRSGYEKLMSSADVAVGSLAFYRNNMHEGCPLKVREYLAYGLPTIIGYRDTDFEEPVPYVLELPNAPTGVLDSLSAIKVFVEKWKGRRVPRELVQRLDTSYKEKQRLEFCRSLIG